MRGWHTHGETVGVQNMPRAADTTLNYSHILLHYSSHHCTPYRGSGTTCPSKVVLPDDTVCAKIFRTDEIATERAKLAGATQSNGAEDVALLPGCQGAWLQGLARSEHQAWPRWA
jgi:hypothetical protein